jgi:hypothetical protein
MGRLVFGLAALVLFRGDGEKMRDEGRGRLKKLFDGRGRLG